MVLTTDEVLNEQEGRFIAMICCPGCLSQQVCQQTRTSPLWEVVAPRTVRKYDRGRSDVFQFHAGESTVICVP